MHRTVIAAACAGALLTSCFLSRGSAWNDRAEPRGRPDQGVAPAVAATPWRAVARSVQGRPIQLRTAGRGPRKVLWIGGIHGNEPEGSVATDELPEAMLTVPGLHERVTLTQVLDLNPDGRQAETRYNGNGVDLNRNFPAPNFEPGPRHGQQPLDQPESRYLFELIRELDPDLILVAHSARRRKFINFDGPARVAAETFARLSGYPLVESTDLHGTPGSLGSWAGIDQQYPILTLEWRNGMDPTVAWQETRSAILAVIDGVPRRRR